MAFPAISGLTLRLEADTCIIDGSNRVSAWTDQASVYGDFIQATDGYKPVKTANAFGTKSGLLFDGSDDVLTNESAVSNLISDSAWEAFVVIRNLSAPATIRGVLNTNNETATNNLGIVSPVNQVGFSTYNKPSGGQTTSAALLGNITGKVFLMHHLHVDGVINVRDGFQKARYLLPIADGGTSSSTALAYGTKIGQFIANTINAYIGAIVVFNRKLTEVERRKVNAYLISEYNCQQPKFFIDPVNGNDTTGTGLSMTTAWKTLKAVLAKTTPMVTMTGYGVIIRRGSSNNEDINGANTAVNVVWGAGSKDRSIIESWGRAQGANATGDFTTGGRTITSVAGITLSLYEHAAQYVTAPDGRKYECEYINGTTIYLFRKYLGDSAVGGTFYFDKDLWYDENQLLNVFDGADDKANWDSDNRDKFRWFNSSATANIPIIYPTGGMEWRGLVIGDQGSAIAGVYANMANNKFLCCYVFRSTNHNVMNVSGRGIEVICCMFKGMTGNNTTNIGISIVSLAAFLFIGCGVRDCYIATSFAGAVCDSSIFYDCAFGINGPSYLAEINYYAAISAPILDGCFIDGTNEVNTSLSVMNTKLISTNHNGIVGNFKAWQSSHGTIIKNTGTGITLPTDGVGWVYECLFNYNPNTFARRYKAHRPTYSGVPTSSGKPIFSAQIGLPSSARSIAIKVMAEDGVSYEELYAEVRWLSDSDDANSGARHSFLLNTNDIDTAASSSDWSQELTLSLPAPAIGGSTFSMVEIFVYGSWFCATSYMGNGTGKVYICPKIRIFGLGGQVLSVGGMLNFAGVDILATKIMAPTGTLSLDKVLKSNPVPGNYDDDNLSVGNVVQDVAFGLSQTGTGDNVAATHTKYLSLETGRNNDNGTVAADIADGKSVKIRGTTTTGTSDKIYSTADEVARNNGASAGIIKLDKTVKQINIDIVGTYAGGAVSAPDAPANPAVTQKSTTRLDVSCDWTPLTERIYFERSVNGTSDWSVLGYITEGTIYSDTTLSAETTRYYRIRNWNTSGYSAYSSVVYGTTKATADIPDNTPVTQLLDSIRAAIIEIDDFSEANVRIGEITDPDSRDVTTAFPCAGIVATSISGIEYVSQRIVKALCNFQVIIYDSVSTENREDGTDMAIIEKYKSAVLRQMFRFNDNSQSGNSPCDGFHKVDPTFNTFSAYELFNDKINISVIDFNINIEAADTAF